MKPKPSEYTKHELLEETIRTALKNYSEEVVNIEEGVIFIIESMNATLKAARVEALGEVFSNLLTMRVLDNPVKMLKSAQDMVVKLRKAKHAN